MEMNRAQATIVRYIKKFHPGATWELKDPAAVTMTENGETCTLGLNLYGDIFKEDTIIARGNTPHDFDYAGYVMPTDWTENF